MLADDAGRILFMEARMKSKGRIVLLFLALLVVGLFAGCNDSSSIPENSVITETPNMPSSPIMSENGSVETPEIEQTTPPVTDEMLYEKAVTAFEQRDFNAALAALSQLPDEYNDVRMYNVTIPVISNYIDGNWKAVINAYLSALGGDTRFNPEDLGLYWDISEYYKASSDKPRDFQNELYGRYIIALLKPNEYAFDIVRSDRATILLNEKIGEIRASAREDIRIFDDASSVQKYLVNEFFMHLFYDSVIHYFEEQADLGNDTGTLPEYAYVPSDFILNNTWGDYYRLLYSNRADKLKTEIRMRGISDYYSSGDNSVSPVELTGNGMFLNYIVAPRGEARTPYFYDQIYEDLFTSVPAHFIANKPEHVRYLLLINEYYEYFGRYDNGTSGYKAIVKVMFKDTASGEILLAKTYEFDPPSRTTATARDTYASPSLNRIVSDFRELIESAVDN